VTHAAVEQTLRVLDDAAYRRQMVERNYALGQQHFSYAVLHRSLREYMAEHHWLA
jgi:hypothetical protein